RIVIWQKARDPAAASRLVKAYFHAFFVDDIDISVPDNAVAVAAKKGLDAAAARAAIDDPLMKEALKRNVEEAITRGVFGSPFIIVDGEPFWGLARFAQVDRALERGAADWAPLFVDYFKGETSTPAYRAINVMGEAPVLEHRGQRLSQSGVLLDSLA